MSSHRTERLVLRPWREEDRAPFAAMNADPRVMQHMPARLTKAESDELAAKIEGAMRAHGFGMWALEVVGGDPFVGFVGLSRPTFEASFTPCVEIGWRLAAHAWGRGYATEAAREALRVGFEEHGLAEILSWTVPANERSWRVMEKLGMRRDPAEDFDHPRLPAWHPLRRHVLYRLSREAWSASVG